MGPRGPEARAHLSGPTQMGKLRRCAEDAASGGEHGGAAPNKSCFFEHRAAGELLTTSALTARQFGQVV